MNEQIIELLQDIKKELQAINNYLEYETQEKLNKESIIEWVKASLKD